MSDLQAKLAALPEYIEAPVMGCLAKYEVEANLDAALARLALAAEWIEKAGHARDCSYHNGYYSTVGELAWFNGPCTCERDALLKKLEGG